MGIVGAIIISLYALGMLRTWALLGDPQHGWSGWPNPLQDLPEPSEADMPSGSS
jgi:hypothetical protein